VKAGARSSGSAGRVPRRRRPGSRPRPRTTTPEPAGRISPRLHSRGPPGGESLARGRSISTHAVRDLAAAVVASGVCTGIGLLVGLRGEPGSGSLLLLGVLGITLFRGLLAGVFTTALSLVAFISLFASPGGLFSAGSRGSATEALSFLAATLIAAAAIWRERRRRVRTAGDLAEQRSLAEQLASSQERLASTLEETRTGIWELDLVRRQAHWSENLGPIYGLERGQQPDGLEQHLELIHPGDRRLMRAAHEAASARGEGHELELRVIHPDGSVHWILDQARVQLDEGGRPWRMLGLTRDITERKVEEERQRFLAQATQLLGASLDYEQTLAELARLAVPRLADWCSIEIARDGDIVPIAIAPADADRIAPARELRASSPVDPALRQGIANVIRSGRSELYTKITDEQLRAGARDAHELELVRSLGLRTAMIVPLSARGRTLGAISLIGAETVSRYDEADLVFAEEVARRAALAVDNARVHEAEQRARTEAEIAAELTTRLQSVTEALSAAVGAGDVSRVIVEHGRAALASDTCYLYLVRAGHFQLVAHAGAPPTEALDDLRRLPVAQETVLSAAMRDGRPLALESIEELAAAYPAWEEAARSHGTGASITVPLMIGERALGVLFASFRTSRRFDDTTLVLVSNLARQAAQALERARLYEQEQRTRSQAEALVDRTQRLQTITEALSAAVSSEDVSQAIIEYGRRVLGADASYLYLVGDDGRLTLSSSRSSVPVEVREPWLSVALDETSSIGAAAQARDVVIVRSAAERRRRFPLLAEAALETGASSSLAIPLVFADRVLGVLFVAFTEARNFDQRDLGFIRNIGRLCAQALERARLYEQEQRTRLNAEETSERLRQLEAIASIGLAAHNLDELLEELLPFLRALLHADRATLLMLDTRRNELRVRASAGLDPETARQVAVPMGRGLDGTIAAEGRPLIADDVRVAGAHSEYLRRRGGSLLGVPLRHSGEVLGVLHVGSDQVAAFDEQDLRLLELAAERVSLAVERAALFEREHEIATTLQRSVRPQRLPEIDRVELAARYCPGTKDLQVGGDWYDVIELGDGRIGLAMGDVVGKGVRAAASMAQVRNALRVYALEGLRPSSVLTRLNHVAESTGTSFATLLYMLVDVKRLICRYASAGHPPAVVVRRGQEPVFLEGGRSVPLGVSRDPGYRQEVIRLRPGDTLLLYTDGLVERRHRSLDEGLSMLLEIVGHGPLELEPLLDHVLEMLAADSEPTDDIALLAFRGDPGAVSDLRLSLPSEAASLAPMRRSLRTWLASVGMDEEESGDLVLACSEACANAVEHAQSPSRNRFEVLGQVHDGDIEVSVVDFGSWRDLPPQTDRGMGLRLIRSTVDDVDIVRDRRGTRVVLRRRLQAPAGIG
jgi:PAS domain S-box-containing protein